jgi:hypothetical protein
MATRPRKYVGHLFELQLASIQARRTVHDEGQGRNPA